MKFVFFCISLTLKSQICHIFFRVVWIYFLDPNDTSVYTIGESTFTKVLDFMNPHSEI